MNVKKWINKLPIKMFIKKPEQENPIIIIVIIIIIIII